MSNINNIINSISKSNKTYVFPLSNIKNDQIDDDKIKKIINKVGLSNISGELLIQPSSNISSSIIESLVNVLIHTPSINMKNYIVNLKNFTINWISTNKPILKELKLNPVKLISCIDNQIDHEDLFMLFSLIFNINILMINDECNFRIYSATNLSNLYILIYQDIHQLYHAVKYIPFDKKHISTLLNYSSIIENNDTIIINILQYLIKNIY